MVITEDLLQWLLADQKVATWRVVPGVQECGDLRCAGVRGLARAGGAPGAGHLRARHPLLPGEVQAEDPPRYLEGGELQHLHRGHAQDDPVPGGETSRQEAG